MRRAKTASKLHLEGIRSVLSPHPVILEMANILLETVFTQQNRKPMHLVIMKSIYAALSNRKIGVQLENGQKQKFCTH